MLDPDPHSSCNLGALEALNGVVEEAMDTHHGRLEAQNGAWRVCRPVIRDSHLFDKKPDPDPQ
jgi:hypothetical protein